MATVYSGSRWNGESKRTGWRIRVDYNGTSASVYVDVVSDYNSSSIWLRFSTGTNTFTKSANTYYTSNNGTRANLLGTLTIDPYTTTTIYETCSGSSWGGNVNGELSVTIPRQYTPAAPTISASVNNITSTGATYTAKMTNNPYSYWRVHIYDVNGSWQNYSEQANVACSYTQTGLAHNTTYNFYYQYTNRSDGEGSGLKPTSFTTSGNAPTISSVSPSPSRTTCSLANNSISYDTNASFKSVSIKYGTSTSYGSTVSSTSLSGLTPNTTYYYSMTVTDNWNRTSSAKTGSFKTTCNAPTSLSISRNTSTINSVTIDVSATGDTNASITNYTLYYRKGTSGSYASVSLGTSTSKTVSGLDADTDYQFYFTATNAGGTGTSSTVTYSTLLSDPTITTPIASDLTPFAVTVTSSGSVTPSRTLQYRFSKDDGSTWTAYQSSNTYNWTGLTEETTYQMKVQVKAIHTGTNASDTTAVSSALVITTPADQAKIRIKKNGEWVKGKTYFKKNGQWVKAKKTYIKKNGNWVIGNNYDPE